ncbi:MAG: hypothetical protein RIR48_2315 [Bacteroidota bacterium]
MLNLVFGLGGQELIVVFIIISIILIPFYYMAKILLIENLPTDKKILWLVAIFVLSYFGLFIFFMSKDYRRMKGYRVSS